MVVQIMINCEGRIKRLAQITFLGIKTREQPQANKLSANSGKRIKSTKLTVLAGDPEMVW